MPAGCFHLSYYYGNSTTDESTKLAPYFLWTRCLSVANVIAWGEKVQVAVCQVIAVSSTLTKLCVCPALGKLKTRPEGLETISQPFAMIGTFHTPCNHLWKNFLRSLLDQAALHTFLFLLDFFFTCGSLWNSFCAARFLFSCLWIVQLLIRQLLPRCAVCDQDSSKEPQKEN